MTAARRRKINSHTQSSSSSSSLYTHTHARTNSTHLSLVCMVSIMATILVLSSSGKEFNSCGSIFFLSETILFCSRRLSKWGPEEKKKRFSPFFFLFFRTLVFFPSFKIYLHTREKKKNIDRGPVTHTCFHFPRWTLINNIIITIVLKATSRRWIRRRWRSWRRNYWTVFSSFSLSWTLSFFFFFSLSLSLSAYFHFRSTTKR